MCYSLLYFFNDNILLDKMVGNYFWNVVEKNFLSFWLVVEGFILIIFFLYVCFRLVVFNVKVDSLCRVDRTLKGYYFTL